MRTLTTKKTRILADTFNWYKRIEIEGTNKRLTRGCVDGKRVYFLETVRLGRMVESVTFNTFKELIKAAPAAR